MPVRLVLVDDHKILRDGLRLRLQQEKDFSVVGEAANAAEAYAMVRETAPDLVVMDLNLPGENGIVATGRIHASWPKVRILVLTGEVSDSAAHDAMLAGANGFLRKEDASDDLVRAIRVVVAGKTYLSPDAAGAVTQALFAKTAAPESELSERELAVLKGLAEGLAYKQIADQLGIGAKSVETYRARLVKKTGCATRAELVRYAVRKGIVAP
jgi:two-component system nitrate/nitrite response regulator NarL